MLPYRAILGLAVQRNALGQRALMTGEFGAASSYFANTLEVTEKLGSAGVSKGTQRNIAILKGREAQSRNARVAAKQAFEEALTRFENTALPATLQRPYVRQLPASLQGAPVQSENVARTTTVN
jgi:hypothetical protein